ncbi:multi-sensor signal transduction multi-kinase [Calothrix sp. NIES-4071]|nr:multi-sensor signal transduction multi-kinase [Calothrix sp. NIES-4071]BAZ54759.1 multi-sensor signal transduction multi-kinase [Calothrix sp. NIES-4105]
MLTLPGYTYHETVYNGEKTLVYRAIRVSDRLPVVIKTLKTNFPTVEETSRFKQEYRILSDLSVAGVIKAYAIERYQNRFMLILEDVDGTSLKAFATPEPLALSEFLTIAIQSASILGEIHQHNIIHKDIKPKNILICPNREIKIIDFSISSRLSKENPSLCSPGEIEGSLSYLSPEQTGRMNRTVDYRSDLYALGVTFYELLTGILPFQSDDPLELIHAHIAKPPLPPHQNRPEIPVVISNILLKLLAKNAEDRYQSAFGLKADLEICQTQLTNTGTASEFTLGQHDTPGLLLIPQKLYGREAEVATLIQAFERIAVAESQSNIELVLVSGYSGIGKSSLVNEIHKPIVQRRGYFLTGKFDQFQRDIPYASLIQALRALIQQVLAESDDRLAAWKTKLQEALGRNGQVIVDVIPEVELIIGAQPIVPTLGGTEAQIRFNRVMSAFIRVFAQASHPLVLFLDDLQWADLASLKFIRALMTDASSGYLLILGAYRDNEVSAAHPLMQMLEQLPSEATIHNIVLSPLNLENVQQLIGETLGEVDSIPLARLIYEKTDGNPFFVTQLLKSLAQANLIAFDFSTARWQWDLGQIETVGVTDNVVELMINKIQKLPTSTQTLLKLAACIGNRFDLETLAVISASSLLKTAEEVWLAMEVGLILPLSQAYKIPLVAGEETVAHALGNRAIRYRFLHDRVQQAAYTLIESNERKATHLKIGRRIRQSQSLEQQTENIFELVNQFNLGINLIVEQAEKNQLAQFNLIAGKKAKAAIAYEPAARYLNLGLELLAPDCWQNDYSLTLDLYEAAIDIECINGNYARAQSLIDVALHHTRILLERIRIYKQQIQLEIAQGDLPASIETALRVLELLEAPIPTDTVDIERYCAQLRAELVFAPKEIATLANLPVMSDPNKRAAMEILNTMPGPVYIVQPQLFMPMMLTMVRLSVEYGNWAPSSFSYCIYGFLSSEVFGNADIGYEFGQLSLLVLEQFNDKTLYPHVLKVYGTHVHYIKNSLRSSLEFIKSSIERSVEVGNIEFLGYGAGEYAMYNFFCGENLETVNQKVLPYIELVERFGQQLGIYYIRIARQVVLNLMGEADNPLILTGDSFNEGTMLPIVEAANWNMLLCCFYLFKLILAYWFGDYEASIAYAESTAAQLDSVLGMMMRYEYIFYHSLTLLARYSGLDKNEQSRTLQQVQANQKILQLKALHAPMNFQHKYELVEAEINRVTGNTLGAMNAYDCSIQSARNHEYTQDEALANELAAKLYLEINKPKIATAYLNDAYLGYASWGATAKTQDLLTRYPDLLAQQIQGRVASITSVSGKTAWLDLSTVVKASQAIASELILENLLNRLIAIVIENAAAQRGFLIAETSAEFVIVAAGAVEQNQIVFNSTKQSQLPIAILNYVVRTGETVVLNNATHEGIFTSDPYIAAYQPKSVLCTPIIYQGQLKNLLYLENHLTTGAFTVERLEILRLLSAQIAVSLENALLYQNLAQTNAELATANTQLEQYTQTLEATVAERTLELKEKNMRLEQTTTQLKVINNELESFSSSVSHDLRAPLRRIDYFTQFLMESASDRLNPKSQDYLTRIQASSQQMRQLIDDLLRLSQISRAELRRSQINLSEMVMAIYSTNFANLQNDQLRQVELKITPNLSTIADAQLLKAALENLLGNAWKYTSKVSLAEIEFGTSHPGVFFIRDNGAGFDMNDADKLFQPFQRLHSAIEFEGNGIGLATVQRIIHRHGGRIWAESKVGSGAIFYFTLEGSKGHG